LNSQYRITMKRRLVLLDTRDHNFDRVLTEALLGTGAVVLIESWNLKI